MSCPDIALPQRIHPSLWRASQLSHSQGRCTDTGYPQLSAQLPGGGWPLGNLIELMVQQPGVGEMQLLRPALNHSAQRPVMLVQPPHLPQITAWANWGCAPSGLMWAHAQRPSDALWTAEQVLRSGTFAVLLLWQDRVRSQTLRRLQLAAQESDTLFVLLRPMVAAEEFSPAPLRLVLRSTLQGLDISILKRRGATHSESIHLPLYPDTRFPEFDHAIMDRRAFAASQPGHTLLELAH